MTKIKPRNNHLRNNKVDNKPLSKANKDQKGPQEVLSEEGNKDFVQKIAELQSETQQYMYSQSSKFSSVSRNLIFGIMGTIWAFSFTNGEMIIKNVCLVFALLLCVLYMIMDVIHYYSDTNSYNKEQYNLDKYKNVNDLDKHEIIMDSINKRSNRFIIWKFRVLVLTSVVFVIGILYQTKLLSTLFNLIVEYCRGLFP